jgi:colanic acid/amylovoran biosynthesis glycosyltransferase
MIKVAHVMRSYLPQPETFIWQYLHMFKTVYPIVIAESLQNLDQFRLHRGKSYRSYGPRLTLPWVADNWYRRVMNQQHGYVARIMRKEGIKVIHAHFGHMGCKYLALSISLKLPLITNFYGYDLSIRDVIKERQSEYCELFEKGTSFFVEGPFMKEQLVSLGCPEEKISIQRIALDLTAYTFKARRSNGSRPVKLLFVGRFVEKKGLKYALKAISKVKKELAFQFRIIGGGELEKPLRALTHDLGLNKEVVWLGMKPHKEVIEELNACDILIQPSVTARNGDSEGGAPTIILEAQACGIPVISTTHADIPYITCPNESALLSPERDIEGLINNIRLVFDNSDLWPTMGTKGRKHVEKFHDVRKEVAVLENIYKNSVLQKSS